MKNEMMVPFNEGHRDELGHKEYDMTKNNKEDQIGYRH